MQEHFAKGGMIKRADGSYSRRGLWDNIRANKGSGRKPTKEMLEQEAKIRSQEQYGGHVQEFGNGGYTVKRSNARKGKTHVVIGPDGTKKYFGDSKLGQHPNDPARKKAFYARHKHNLEHNPYFRAFARATWADGGEIPMYVSGTVSVDPAQLSQDQLTNWNRFQYYASNHANITDPAYNTDRQKGYDLLNQYNQANPNNQITADSIPTYQAYFQKLQAGQTNVGQAGQQYVQKNFTQGVSPTDAFIGTQTLSSRVPMRGKKTVTNANTGQVVYNSGSRPSTALPTPAPSQPVAQTNVSVPGMQSATLAYGGATAAKMQKYFGGGPIIYSGRVVNKLKNWRNPGPDDTEATTFAMGGLTKYQNGDTVDYNAELAKWKQEHGQPTYSGSALSNNGIPGGQMTFTAPAGTTFGKAPKVVEQPVTTIAEDKANLSEGLKQNAAAFNRPELSRKERRQQELEERIKNRASIEKIEEVPISIRNTEKTLNNQIPTSLIKAAPITKSYLENTYESTEGIPKTVLEFFGTGTQKNTGIDEYNYTAPIADQTVIFDHATGKAYKRTYNPKTKKYSITANEINPDQLEMIAGHPNAVNDSSSLVEMRYSDNFDYPSVGCKAGNCFEDENGVIGSYGYSDPEAKNQKYYINQGNPYGRINAITIDSSKSFDDNINMMKTNMEAYGKNDIQASRESEIEKLKEDATKTKEKELGRPLTKAEKAEILNGLGPQIQDIVKKYKDLAEKTYDPNNVTHDGSHYYIPEIQQGNPLINAYNEGVSYAPTEEGVKEYLRDLKLKEIQQKYKSSGLNYDQLIDLERKDPMLKSNNFSRLDYFIDPEMYDQTFKGAHRYSNIINFTKPANFNWLTPEEKNALQAQAEINYLNANLEMPTQYQQYLDQYKDFMEKQMNQRKFGGKIYRRGGNIRKFYVGGDNDVDLSQQQPQPGVYNFGQAGPSSQGNYSQQQYSTNVPGQNNGTFNFSTFGPTQTAPQTGNSGQGINTTTPAVTPAPAASPAVASTTPQTTAPAQTTTTASTSYGMIGPPADNNTYTQQTAPAQTSVTPAASTASTNTGGSGLGPVKYNILNQNPNYPASQLPGATPTTANTGLSGSEIASRNQEYEDRMIKEYGIKRKDIDKRYEELSSTYKNSSPEDIYSAMSKEFGDQAKQNKQDEALKAEKARLKTIAGGMKGASQAFDAAFAGADLLSRMNPNSSPMAVVRKNRENANLTNTMNIVGNRKGIEYSAYGGYTGLKEGVELDLTTQQIHELEKQGYKFQIL